MSKLRIGLTRKVDLVLTLPTLRKFVCSPWTHLEKLYRFQFEMRLIRFEGNIGMVTTFRSGMNSLISN